MRPVLKYREIVAFIRKAVDEGVFPYGSKIPSLRRTASQFSCSMSVVLQAYRELEMEGVILPVEKSGYFATCREVATLAEPEVGDYSLKAKEIRMTDMVQTALDLYSREDMLPLGAAMPDSQLLPCAQLRQVVGSAFREPHVFNNMYPAGHPELRRAVARYLQGYNVFCDYEDVVITNGCMEALSLAIRTVTSPGDIVALETPAFFGFYSLLEMLGRRVVEIPVSPQDGIDVAALEKATSSEPVRACICTANFQNPLGFRMSAENKQKLVEFATSSGIVLIEDDVYGSCSFDGFDPAPLKSRDDSGDIIYCSSFSKSLAPGLRTGWALPGRYLDEFRRLKMAETLGGIPGVQVALARFLEQGGYGRHLRRFRRALHGQLMQTRAAVLEYFPAGTTVSLPEGGYFLWVELPEYLDTVELFNRCVEEKIGFMPGRGFSVSDRYRSALRLSCGTPFTGEIRMGIVRMGEVIGSMG